MRSSLCWGVYVTNTVLYFFILQSPRVPPNNPISLQVYCTECSEDHVDHPIGTVKDAAMAAVQSMTSLASAARERLPDLQVYNLGTGCKRVRWPKHAI